MDSNPQHTARSFFPSGHCHSQKDEEEWMHGPQIRWSESHRLRLLRQRKQAMELRSSCRPGDVKWSFRPD